MEQSALLFFHAWFNRYVQSFFTTDPDIQSNIIIKKNHTLRVCKIINALGQSLNLNRKQLQLAETAALFHDIGRFPQYYKYRTFNDARSTNHAVLGLKTLEETNILSILTVEEISMISKAVLFHNRRELPVNEDPKSLLLAKMVRDADKLDIFEMITTDDAQRRIPSSPEYSDTATYSALIISDILANNMARFEDIRTTADQLLFRLSWIFNFYFSFSCSYFLKKGYLEKSMQLLPDTEDIRNVHDHLFNYLQKKAASH